nr:hypothetical protein [Tanacetum cinerariifolium]
KPARKVTEVPQPSETIEIVVDEAVYKELNDRLMRSATTASSLEADQDNESSDEETLGEDASRHGRIDDIDANEDITLVNIQADAEMFDADKDLGDKEEVAIDAIPFAVKSLGIVDCKIYKEGKKSYYQIIRADGKLKMYMFFSQMLTSFDIEDLEHLYKSVKAKIMSSSNHPIILYDSNVDDAFSSTNIPNYTSALPNYSPASPGNTFSDLLENLTQNLLAALAILPFHDDPYMKVMQAYNAELPIQAPIAAPPSPVLSSQFDSRDFFLPKEILPPQK